jgi:hypothetical protein
VAVKILLSVGGVLVLLVALLTLFESEPSQTPEQKFLIGVNSTLRDFQRDYTAPVTAALDRSAATCSIQEPRADLPECDELVKALEESAPHLRDTISNLESLLNESPPDAPDEILQRTRDLVRILEHVEEADGLLIRGWKERSSEQWDAGWASREEVASDARTIE